MRTFIFILVSFIVLAAVALGFAPQYFSTASGNQILAKIINWKISGQVAFDKADFSWTGKQSIKNLILHDHNGDIIVTIDSIETDTPLFSLLVDGKLGESQIRKLNLHIVKQPDGTSNLQQAIENDIPPPLDPNAKPLIVDFENVNGMVSMGTPSIPKKIHLIGTTRQGDISGSFNIEIDSHNDDKNMIMEVQVKQFPIAILDELLAYENPDFADFATTTLGDTLDVDLSNTHREGTSSFKLNIQSARFLANLQGQMTRDLLTISTPSEISLTVTPAFVSYFTDEKPLNHNATAVVVLDQMTIPVQKEISELAVKFHLDQKKSDPSIVKYLDGTEISIDTKKGLMPHLMLVNQDLQADVLIDTEAMRVIGSLRSAPEIDLNIVAQFIDGKGLNLSIKGSKLNAEVHFKDSGNYQIQLQANQFPITKICHLVCFEEDIHEKIEAVLGHTITGTIDAKVHNWSGHVMMSLAGEHGAVSLDGFLRQGVLHLNNPFVAKLQLTPLLGREFLQEIFPLFSGVISGQEPVTLVVSPEHFALPLNPFNLQGITISSAELDMNKVIFSNEGELGSILSLLNPQNEDRLLVWFTPLYFSMAEGALRLERIDMLVMGEYPIAAWGKVNLAKEKVSLVIGLSARAIEQAFRVKGLSPNYMLQLALKGPLNNAKIDKRKAAAKISSLVAQSQGIEGSVIGTVIDIASGNLKEKSPPEPTTYPLPWDEGQNQPKSAPVGRHRKKASFVLDKVEKGASSIIRGR